MSFLVNMTHGYIVVRIIIFLNFTECHCFTCTVCILCTVCRFLPLMKLVLLKSVDVCSRLTTGHISCQNAMSSHWPNQILAYFFSPLYISRRLLLYYPLEQNVSWRPFKVSIKWKFTLSFQNVSYRSYCDLSIYLFTYLLTWTVQFWIKM